MKKKITIGPLSRGENKGQVIGLHNQSHCDLQYGKNEGQDSGRVSAKKMGPSKKNAIRLVDAPKVSLHLLYRA